MGGRLQRRWHRRLKVACWLGRRARDLGHQRRVGGAGRNDSGGGDGRHRGDSGQPFRSLNRFISPRELMLLRHEPRMPRLLGRGLPRGMIPSLMSGSDGCYVACTGTHLWILAEAWSVACPNVELRVEHGAASSVA